MLPIACCLAVRLGLRLDLVCGKVGKLLCTRICATLYVLTIEDTVILLLIFNILIVIVCRGHVSTRSGHINYNNYCRAFDQRSGFGYVILFLVRSKGIL